jgi:polyhydroxyalkanoate synthesis regulator protein
MNTPFRQPSFKQGTLRRTKTINLAKTNEEVDHQLETTIWMAEDLKRKSDSILDQEIRERIEVLVSRATKKTKSDQQKQLNKMKHICLLLSDLVEESALMIHEVQESQDRDDEIQAVTLQMSEETDEV